MDKKTANYKIVKEEKGNSYRFFCDLSDALIYKSTPVTANSSEEELRIAWENHAREHFNQCRKCGKWVTGAMYNPDVLCCVQCMPIEDYPDYCPECGKKTQNPSNFCHMCGAKLFYGGEANDK